MDFLKTCSTNIHRVDDIHLIKCAVYVHHQSSDAAFDCHTVLAELREANILCSYSDKLYTFNAPDDILNSRSLVREEEGTLEQYTSATPASEVVERFKDAVEQGLTFRAGNKHLFKLGSWSWLSTSGQHGSSPYNTLIQIRTRLVSPGILSFAVLLERVPLTAIVTSNPQGEAILLSPSGISATTVEATPEVGPAQQAWLTNLAQRLKCQGISLDNEEPFVQIELDAAPGQSILWPRRLCFTRQTIGNASRTKPATESPLDALTFAQQWAESADDRQQALLAVHSEVTGSLENNLDDGIDLVISPPFQYRPGLSNMTGVYPTPPEGMTSNAATQSIIAQETPVQLSDLSHDSSDLFRVQTHDADAAFGLRARVSSVASSAGIDLQQTGTDDLFGEGDADLGSGEVDEDDFDFFDDQGGHMLTIQPQEQAPIVSGISAAQSPSLETAQAPADHVMTDASPSPMDNPACRLMDTPPQPAELGTALASMTSSQASGTINITKPLSPFDIRERLLPPPVPASMSNQNLHSSSSRRQSSFAPVIFNPHLRLGSRAHSSLRAPLRSQSNLALSPADTSASSHSYGSPTRPAERHPEFSGNEEDLSDSSVDTTRAMPPVLPWLNRKRKRIVSIDVASPMSWSLYASPVKNTQLANIPALLQIALESTWIDHENLQTLEKRHDLQDMDSLEAYFHGTAKDLLMIAQLVSEQAISCTNRLATQLSEMAVRDFSKHDASSLQDGLAGVLRDLMPSCRCLEPMTVALQRERANLQPVKGQPRPPPRLDTAPSSELFSVAVPYLRFQRADMPIEMLPPALAFWDALSLAPHNLGKNIRPCIVAPDQTGVQSRVDGFLNDLKVVYEGCKLGQIFEDASAAPWNFVVDTGGATSNADFYTAYQSTCAKLADQLAEQAYANPDYSFVVMMVDTEQTIPSAQRLCACFYLLYKSYSDKVLGKGASKKASDICLQLLPASLISSPDNLSMLSGHQTATIAREIYDRCPPGPDLRIASPFSIAATPSLVLAEPIPKRIVFQQSASVPTDLLHEGSELHVAYAKSADGVWITAAWSDNTGANQQISSFCLRGTTVAAVYAEIWDRSLSIMRARSVSWRLGIATADVVDELEVQCWRNVMSQRMANRVAIHASLVLVRVNPLLRIERPAQELATSITSGGVVTPVSTPQSSGLIVSPEASGQAAPPTPAPTEPSVELDPDAHLVDLSDETWGMLLDPKYDLAQHVTGTIHTAAQGALAKHGNPDDGSTLPVAGVSIAFTLRIRGNSMAAEDATAKQAEIILKELLTAYRGLSLLARARDLQDPVSRGLPLHIVSVLKSAEALQGLLRV
ncbi:hypothetical protein AMS68_007022 [Peltaster fructicola]|uniref:Mediator of RNA polymerase II transcription subunit 13 n=1 Tax=Peltaster fructicola TaxID=286661 RepID=A0A6H0Y3J2_9PEZI|nr:hypothetical protein AMS68_007022 [Peltaster fructicola]